MMIFAAAFRSTSPNCYADLAESNPDENLLSLCRLPVLPSSFSLLLFTWSILSGTLDPRLVVVAALLLIYRTTFSSIIQPLNEVYFFVHFLYSLCYFSFCALTNNTWLLFHKEINWRMKEKRTTITAFTFPSETIPKLPNSIEWLTVITEPGWKLLTTIFYHKTSFVKIKMCLRKISSLKKFQLEEVAVICPDFIIPY